MKIPQHGGMDVALNKDYVPSKGGQLREGCSSNKGGRVGLISAPKGSTVLHKFDV
jgi:hypothetical protein